MTNNLPPALNVVEAAALLRISEKTCREAIARGEVPSLRIGHRVIVPTARLLLMLGIDMADGAAGSFDERGRIGAG